MKESHIIGMITAIGEEEEIVKLNYSQIILACMHRIIQPLHPLWKNIFQTHGIIFVKHYKGEIIYGFY